MSTGHSAHQRPVSVKDVAAEAGVSLGTVSNVLNRPGQVSEATRSRVERAMRDLGFVRNESARQLRAGKSRVLAYVMLDGVNPFFLDVAKGVETTARAHDLALFTCNSDQDSEREESYLHLLAEQRVQGVLITPVDPDSETLSEVADRGTPVVVVDRIRTGDSHCSVAVDDPLGGRLAVAHLIEHGHTRVAFIGGPQRLGQVQDRRLGAQQAMMEAGLPRDHLTDVRTEALSVEAGLHAGRELDSIPADQRPTAAFCGNDLVALGLLQHCVAHGIRVPEDLAIVGYDDIDFAAAAAVPLTSVRQPRHDLGQRAAELLLDEASNPDHQHSQVTFTPELIARASTTG